MTVFKTFWNIVKKYKGTIILYTVMLIVFGGLNMSTSDNTQTFTNTKPDILIINNDSKNIITNNLVKYLKKNNNVKNIKGEDAINDALFYRDIDYIINIPKNYGKNIMNGLNPTINVKQTGNYMASLSEMMLKRYIKIQNIYKERIDNEKELVKLINNNLDSSSKVLIKSKINTSKAQKTATYFNFASYSIMAIVIFIICLVLSSFKEKTIKKRTIISSTNYRKFNLNLLLASFVYSIIVWILFILLGYILLGDIVFTTRGLVYMLNSFVFTFCSLTVALLISTLVNDKNAVEGIVNVIALGTSFLSGVFVPAEVLPKSVLTIAHAFPTYWYVNSNDLLKSIEVINYYNLLPVFSNIIILVIFSLLFIIINNVITRFKQKVG